MQDAELRQLLVDIARRHATSRGGGRLSKHDAARRWFILEKALESLRLGVIVPESDMAMLRGGTDWADGGVGAAAAAARPSRRAARATALAASQPWCAAAAKFGRPWDR